MRRLSLCFLAASAVLAGAGECCAFLCWRIVDVHCSEAVGQTGSKCSDSLCEESTVTLPDGTEVTVYECTDSSAQEVTIEDAMIPTPALAYSPFTGQREVTTYGGQFCASTLPCDLNKFCTHANNLSCEVLSGVPNYIVWVDYVAVTGDSCGGDEPEY